MNDNTVKLEQSIPNPANQSTSIQYVQESIVALIFI